MTSNGWHRKNNGKSSEPLYPWDSWDVLILISYQILIVWNAFPVTYNFINKPI